MKKRKRKKNDIFPLITARAATLSALTNTTVNTAHVKVGRESYFVLFNDESRAVAIRHLNKFVLNPDLNFHEADAYALGQKIMEKKQDIFFMNRRF